MDTNHPEILYKDSPFVPLVLPEDIDEIKLNLLIKKISPLDAIAQQAGHIGHALNILHEKEKAWISTAFQCQYGDIVIFYLGYSTPVQMILSAIQMDYASIQTVIKNLTQKTESKLLTDHNIHKVRLLHDAYYIVANTTNKKPQTCVEPIKKLCLRNPFTRNPYYLAGIEAACYTLESLCNKYNSKDPVK